MLLISLSDPMITEVPESTTASQLAEHATVFPLMVMLQHKGSIDKNCISQAINRRRAPDNVNGEVAVFLKTKHGDLNML